MLFKVSFPCFLVTHFVSQHKGQPVIYYRLSAQNIVKIFKRYVNIRKYIKVRLPLDFCTRCSVRLVTAEASFFLFNVIALFKSQIVYPRSVIALDLHILSRKLRRAKAKTVKAERV